MASELFVPYMDPSEAWYFKTYMDAGEYGFGLQAMPLVPLNDCPRHARYLDGVFVAADGRPYVRENMICVFERYAGDVAWRHSESPITGMDVSVLTLSIIDRSCPFFSCCASLGRCVIR
jgi:primary-amine oxidase